MDGGPHPAYGAKARGYHWWTAGLLAVQAALGLAMAVRGGWLGIWDGVTNASYSTHKLLGVAILVLVAARLLHRIRHGGPAPEPTLGPWQRRVSRVSHWAMYGLLVALPVTGWFGVQLYPALDLFGLVSLPAVVAPDKAASGWVLRAHGIAAGVLASLVAVHVAAALHHRYIRKDGVLRRMLPGARVRPP